MSSSEERTRKAIDDLLGAIMNQTPDAGPGGAHGGISAGYGTGFGRNKVSGGLHTTPGGVP
jgi:hypothetical protein